MARRCYRVREGTQITLEPDGRYLIQAPGGQPAHVHPPALGPALLVDGRRSEEEIERALAGMGLTLPSGVVNKVLGSLEVAGVLEEHETSWLPLQSHPWPEHRCQGCGACCQGHWIGPLQSDFVAQTTERMGELREKYPALEGRRAFVRIERDDPALYLNSETGQCVFLDTDLRCILHKEYGSDSKPTICRMFPHVRFEDGRNTRLGVGLSCLIHFDQVVDGDKPAAESHWAELNDAIDGGLYHYYSTTQLEHEEDIIASLPHVDDPLAELVGAVTPDGGRSSGRVGAAKRLPVLLSTHLRRVEAVLAEEPIMDGLAEQPGPFPDTVRAIRAAATNGIKGPLPRPAAVRSDALNGLLEDALLRFLFYRQYLMFVGLQHGTAALTVGIATALALTASEPDRERSFGRHLAAWMRIIQSPAVRRELFKGPDEVVRFLRGFEQYWRA